jgi:hypothetical protein
MSKSKEDKLKEQLLQKFEVFEEYGHNIPTFSSDDSVEKIKTEYDMFLKKVNEDNEQKSFELFKSIIFNGNSLDDIFVREGVNEYLFVNDINLGIMRHERVKSDTDLYEKFKQVCKK